jgi:hypothetical protein
MKIVSSFLGSTAQLRPWPPPQNPAEFLGDFSIIFFLQGRVVSPTPNPHPGEPGLCIYIPQRQGGYPFWSPLMAGMGVYHFKSPVETSRLFSDEYLLT